MQTGNQLRLLFVTLLRECCPADPKNLCDEFRDFICDDLKHRLLSMNHTDPSPDEVYDYGLYLLDKELHKFNDSLVNYPAMPQVQGSWADAERHLNQYVLDQLLPYQADSEAWEAILKSAKFNEGQRTAYETILHSCQQPHGKVFFLNGPAGTGKTFCYSVLCYHLRGERRIVLCVASSGIAATLLKGGRTAHSTFKIPIKILANSTCSIKKNSKLADLMRQVSLIIWDEVPMQHRHCVEAVNRMLKDIRDSTLPFGGITTVFGGDFQQILPVIPKGTMADIIQACIQRSSLWQNVQILHLKENMRLGQTAADREYASWLQSVGQGLNTAPDGSIQLPPHMRCGNTVQSLIDAVYPGIRDPAAHLPRYFMDRTILCGRNDDVDGSPLGATLILSAPDKG